MQPTPNPTLLNGHAHTSGNGHHSLLPEGGGAGASPAEGAPSSTPSTPPPPSSTPSLRHSVSASLSSEDLLLDYLRRDLSLIDLARAHHLSLQELIAWSQLPSTRASLQALRETAAERDATHAALARRRAIDALSTILEAFAYEESHEVTRDTPLGAITKWRRRETARRAATTLIRLTGSPASPRAAEPAPPAPGNEPLRAAKAELPPTPAPESEPTPPSTDPNSIDSLHDIRRANGAGFGAIGSLELAAEDPAPQAPHQIHLTAHPLIRGAGDAPRDPAPATRSRPP
jgi:hypothetical protein